MLLSIPCVVHNLVPPNIAARGSGGVLERLEHGQWRGAATPARSLLARIEWRTSPDACHGSAVRDSRPNGCASRVVFSAARNAFPILPRKTMRARAGFTLIELLVTLAIIGILASAVVPLAELTVKRSKEQELRVALRNIRGALDAYKRAVDEGRVARKADESGYPPALDLLVQGVQNEKHPKKEKIYFIRRLPRDPFSSDSSVPAALTWGKRSYASPHDEPKEGKDVYDVYSLATGIGLNGIPYREW